MYIFSGRFTKYTTGFAVMSCTWFRKSTSFRFHSPNLHIHSLCALQRPFCCSLQVRMDQACPFMYAIQPCRATGMMMQGKIRSR